jgi:quinol monooxygenase YgiN
LLEIGVFGNIAGSTTLLAYTAKQQRRGAGKRGGEMFFVVVVDFQLKPGARPQFRGLIDVNADASVRDEPGCVQFDVLEPEGEDDRVLLYEIYLDRAAFDAHRQTEHFHVFNSASENLCLKKSVIRCDLVRSGADVVSKR